jgi:hypothetical protein
MNKLNILIIIIIIISNIMIVNGAGRRIMPNMKKQIANIKKYCTRLALNKTNILSNKYTLNDTKCISYYLSYNNNYNLAKNCTINTKKFNEFITIRNDCIDAKNINIGKLLSIIIIIYMIFLLLSSIK